MSVTIKQVSPSIQVVRNGTTFTVGQTTGGGNGSGGSGLLYATDAVANSVLVSSPTYQDAADTVLTGGTLTNASALVDFTSSYPLVASNAGTTELTLQASGLYTGQVAVTLTAGTNTYTFITTTPDGGGGASQALIFTLDAPPAVTSALFSGGYPGAQTELKQGDTYTLDVVADKAFDRVTLADSGASAGQTFAVGATTSTSVVLTVADRGTSLQALAALVSVRDASTAAESATYSTDTTGTTDGVNRLNLNNLFPTLTFGAIVYPGAQAALKGVEVATVAITSANLDSILYDSPNGDLTVTNPTTDETPKTVTRLAGSYNISVNNFRGVATRNANDAVVTAQNIVQIANVAVVVTVTTPAARLRSGGNDGTSVQTHTITIIGDQELLNAPTMDAGAGSAGTFIGVFAGGPSTWTRTLQVDDDDDKGLKSWANLVATNLAGTVTNTVTTGPDYTLGGFVQRTLTAAAFASTIVFNAEVLDFSKIQAGNFSPGGPSSRQPIGTVADTANGYTVDAVSINPTTLELLDLAAIAANSLGLYNLANFEEVV